MGRILISVVVGIGLILVTLVSLTSCDGDGWRNRRNDSAGLAPDAAATTEAVVQVYGAAVYGWRGAVADHTWVTVKPANAVEYTIYQVVGWRLRRGMSVVSVGSGVPDRYWYGSVPDLHLDIRGEAAAELIDHIDLAARSYPYTDQYVMWPGPNSNSFVQWIALEVPQMGLKLPWRAWGKLWMMRNYPPDSNREGQ
jgi:hypothetical protein